MFVDDPLTGDSAVFPLFFFSQRVQFSFLFGQFTAGVQFLDTGVAGVGLAFGIRVKANTGLFKEPEVVLLALAETGTDNLGLRQNTLGVFSITPLGDNQLRL